MRSHNDNNPYVLVFGGSFTTAYINRPGPDPTEQLPAWNWNPWGYEMRYIMYPGSKFDQAQKANSLGISGDTILICYSAGAEACLLYASSQFSEGNTVSAMVLIGATFTGSDMESASDIGFDGWANYMDTALINGTDVLIVDDRWPLSSTNEKLLAKHRPPENSQGNYLYIPSFYKHYDSGHIIPLGSNNNPISVASTYAWIILLSLLR